MASENWLLLGVEVVVSFVVVWRHRWWPLTACCLPSEQQSFAAPYVRDLEVLQGSDGSQA
jgi:hypothetical protein